jgi:hypothetical protein
MENNLETVVKSLINEYLETTKVFDSVMQEFNSAHRNLSEYKKNNPEASALDVKDKLLDFFKIQQKGALIMKDAEAYLNRLVVLKVIADFGSIDLGLSEEDLDLFTRATKAVNIFYTSRNGQLVNLQPEVVEEFTNKTLDKYAGDDKLQELLNKI